MTDLTGDPTPVLRRKHYKLNEQLRSLSKERNELITKADKLEARMCHLNEELIYVDIELGLRVGIDGDRCRIDRGIGAQSSRGARSR